MNNILLLSLIALIGFSIIQTTQAFTLEDRDKVVNDIKNQVATELYNDECLDINPDTNIERCNQLKQMINETTQK